MFQNKPHGSSLLDLSFKKKPRSECYNWSLSPFVSLSPSLSLSATCFFFSVGKLKKFNLYRDSCMVSIVKLN